MTSLWRDPGEGVRNGNKERVFFPYPYYNSFPLFYSIIYKTLKINELIKYLKFHDNIGLKGVYMSINPCPLGEAPHCSCKGPDGTNITGCTNGTVCINSGGEWSSYCYKTHTSAECHQNQDGLTCVTTSDCRWDGKTLEDKGVCYYYGTGCSSDPLKCKDGEVCTGYCLENNSLDYSDCMNTKGYHWRQLCIASDACTSGTESTCSSIQGCTWNGTSCVLNTDNTSECQN